MCDVCCTSPSNIGTNDAVAARHENHERGHCCDFQRLPGWSGLCCWRSCAASAYNYYGGACADFYRIIVQVGPVIAD